MRPSKKQYIVLEKANQQGGEFTKSDAMSWPGINTHYCNGRKHVGDMLSRMVRAGYIERVKRGQYKVTGTGRSSRKAYHNPQQTRLLI